MLNEEGEPKYGSRLGVPPAKSMVKLVIEGQITGCDREKVLARVAKRRVHEECIEESKYDKGGKHEKDTRNAGHHGVGIEV